MKKQELLTNWVQSKHEGQTIKLLGGPYFNHLLEVARMSAQVMLFGYEVGLCHDVLEKTETSVDEFQAALFGFGYGAQETRMISDMVVELTDVYTKRAYPDLHKSSRKKREEERLATISAGAQTVKYCDLIYNINWMMNHKREKARTYLKRKEVLLRDMNTGDQDLYQQITALIHTCLLAV